MSISQDEKGCEPQDENVLYSFPAFNSFDNGNGGSNEMMPPLVLELIPLPLLSENFEQMPVGARGWYASAILSAMMMLSYNNINWDDDLGARSESDEDDSANIKNLKVMNGIDLLREDLKRACAGSNRDTTSTSITKNNNIFLELGSGTVGLAGMTMAWIVAQHERNNKKMQDSSNSRNTVMLTDYDHDCLEQLERNAVGVRRMFREYFSVSGSKDDDDKNSISSNGIIPDIDVVHLDWNEYDQDQSPIFPEKTNIDDDGIHHKNNISFACGAALVYTEDTAACVDQVAKILRLHPKSVVWVVQWPRGGWFNIFQQELLSRRYESEGLKIDVHKFGPSSSPDMFSAEVQQLAQKLMPATIQQECQMTIKDLRAIRIANITAE